MAFAPITTTDGSDWHGKMREVEIGAAVANTFLGDMMALSGTGSADGRAEGVILGTAGDAVAFGAAGTSTDLAGAVVSFTPDFTDEGTLVRNFHLTGTAQLAKLVYGSQVVYQAETINALAITDIASNRNIAVGAGGSTVTGIGTHGIGAAPVAPDLGQLRIIGASREENDLGVAITDVGAVWRVRLNASVDQQRTDGA
jgi:hypothetical protein